MTKFKNMIPIFLIWCSKILPQIWKNTIFNMHISKYIKKKNKTSVVEIDILTI